MKTKIMSKPFIKKLILSGKFPSNTAVLSFYGEFQEKMNFPPNIKHLCLCIDDFRTMWEVENPETFHIPDFERAARFVLECEKLGLDIICQCEAGHSRSAGASMAIEEFYNHDGIKIFADYLYSPNPIFYNNLYNCLNKIRYK